MLDNISAAAAAHQLFRQFQNNVCEFACAFEKLTFFMTLTGPAIVSFQYLNQISINLRNFPEIAMILRPMKNPNVKVKSLMFSFDTLKLAAIQMEQMALRKWSKRNGK